MSIAPTKVTRQDLYTFSTITDSPTGLETRIGMSSKSQCKSRPIANEEDTYENVDPGSNNKEAVQSQTKILPVITASDVSASDLPGKA